MSTLFDGECRLTKKLSKSAYTPWLIRKARSLFRPSTINHMGVKLAVEKHLFSKREIRSLYRGVHEKSEARILRTIIEPSDRIVEIGAGFGLTGILCGKIVGSQNIVCFEANEELKPVIEKNMSLNNIDLTVIFSPVTVDGGTCEFHRTGTFVGSGTTKTDATVESYQCQSVALRDVLEKYKPNTLIVDVEGGEVDLLAEPLDGVEKIIVEIHPHKTSNANLRKMTLALLQQGFTQIHDLTMEKGLCFYRPVTEEACAS